MAGSTGRGIAIGAGLVLGFLWLLNQGPGSGGGAPPPAPPQLLELRLTGTGLELRPSGQPIALAVAVELGKGASRVDLYVTGEAKFGELEKVRAAFRDGGVPLFEHGSHHHP